MDFREKIEAAVAPLVGDLRGKLASLSTLSVLDHYQMLSHAAQLDKGKFPDGFWFKWRYLWALLLSNPFAEGREYSEADIKFVDDLIEKIFELYAVGAVLERGRNRGSEKEFLARLGLALRVREPDILGFPEQIRSWALLRLQPFDDSYFVPTFGLRFSEILGWFDGLIGTCENRLNAFLQDMVSITREIKQIDDMLARGEMDLPQAQKAASDARLAERFDKCGTQGEATQIFTLEDLRRSISGEAVDKLVLCFGVRPGEVERAFTFPHDENPLESKTFVILPDNTVYFLDPANVYRIAAKTFEREILDDPQLRDRYLRNRDRATERRVTEKVKSVFPTAEIYPNYYLTKGTREKDLLIRHGDTVILIECKNYRVRSFSGSASDLLKYQGDFQNSVQYGFDQANEAKGRILDSDEATFLDKKGQFYFSIRRKEVRRIYILCVTITPRGPFGPDVSYELRKPAGEPFPLALNLFDFETICKHLNTPAQFIAYLAARESLHGRVVTGDELNYAGYFLRFGNLDFEAGSFVNDDFSGVFDRRWYKERGFDVEEPTTPPVLTSMIRGGNRVFIEHSTGQREVIKLQPEFIEAVSGKTLIKMRGADRNKPCPCGSGRKMKHCCGKQ